MAVFQQISLWWRRWLNSTRSWWVKLRHGGRTAPSLEQMSQRKTADNVVPTQPHVPTSPPRLRLGTRLTNGTGGQGSVYRVADDPALVYKQYTTPIEGSLDSFADLIRAGRRVALQAPAHVDFTWPIELFGRGDHVAGYTMQRLPEHYAVTIRNGGRTTTVLGQLMHALPRDGAFQVLNAPDEHQRLALAIMVAEGLVLLHAHSVSYRDLSLMNLVFSTNPLKIGFMDMDSARVISQHVIPAKDGVDTRDWVDPLFPDDPIGFDVDRFKYALLVHRLLVTHRTIGEFSPRAIRAITAVDGIQKESLRDLQRLFLRALGPAGTRPPVEEWRTVLRDGAKVPISF